MSCPSSIQTKVGCPISRFFCEKWDSTNANTLGFLAFASRGLYRFQIPFCSRRSARGQGSEPMLTNKLTPYNEAFPAGSRVRIADRDFLEMFKEEWKHHHKLQPEQLTYSDQEAIVK